MAATGTRGRTPARWTTIVPPAMLGLLGLGFALTAASVLYDLTQWDTVYAVSPQTAADRSGLVDLGGQVISEVLLFGYAVALIVVLISAMGLVRSKPWAYVTAGVLAASFALFCGIQYASAGGFLRGGFDDPEYINPRSSYAPSWLLVCDTVGPVLIVGGALAALTALLLPPVRDRYYPTRYATQPLPEDGAENV